MPRYFFHVEDGRSIPDDEGVELPDIYAAQAEAIRTSAEILRDEGSQFWDGTDWLMEVTDERGHILFVLRFSAEDRLELAHVSRGRRGSLGSSPGLGWQGVESTAHAQSRLATR